MEETEMKPDELVRQTPRDIRIGKSDAQHESRFGIATNLVEDQLAMALKMASFDVTAIVSKEAGGTIAVWCLDDLKTGGRLENTDEIGIEVPAHRQSTTEQYPRNHIKSR
jgi:hypothetical protein